MVDKLKNIVYSSDLLQRVLKAILYGIGGSVGSRIIIILSEILIARILGKEFYGQFAMINSTVNLFVIFAGVGIGATLTRYVSFYRNDSIRLGNIIGSLSKVVSLASFIMTFCLFLFSEKISVLVSGNDILTDYFRFAAFIIFFAALSSIQQSILLGMEMYKKNARIELVRCGVYLALAAIFSIWLGVRGTLFALLISHIIRFCLYYYHNINMYRNENIILSFHLGKEICRIMYQFTLPAFVASLFVIPVNWINNSILARQVGFGELAVFSVSLQWMTIATYIPLQMSQVKPIYSDLFSQGQFIKLKQTFKTITVTSIIFIIPVVIGGIFFGKYILQFYGAGYESGYATFVLLMISAFLITLQSQVGSLLEAMGAMWGGFALNLIWSISIITVFYELRYLGSTGYAIAYCLSYAIHNVFSYGVVYFLWKKGVTVSGKL